MILSFEQNLTIILLLVVLIPIAALICVAFVLKFKKACKNVKQNNFKLNNEQENDNLIEQKEVFLLAYGGSENIKEITQERNKIIVTVNDINLVNGEKLKELGANGVLLVGNTVKASFGDRTSGVYGVLKL